jgi:hypothetical protein
LIHGTCGDIYMHMNTAAENFSLQLYLGNYGYNTGLNIKNTLRLPSAPPPLANEQFWLHA